MISTFRIANSMDILTKAEDQESIKSVVVKTKDHVAVRKEIVMVYSSAAGMERIKCSLRKKKPSPCKDCTERHLGCHSECSLYSSWKDDYFDKKRSVFKNYAVANACTYEAKRRVDRYTKRKQDIQKRGQK